MIQSLRSGSPLLKCIFSVGFCYNPEKKHHHQQQKTKMKTKNSRAIPKLSPNPKEPKEWEAHSCPQEVTVEMPTGEFLVGSSHLHTPSTATPLIWNQIAPGFRFVCGINTQTTDLATDKIPKDDLKSYEIILQPFKETMSLHFMPSSDSV